MLVVPRVMRQTAMKTENKSRFRARRILQVLGISMVLPFFIWLAIGWLPGIPSIIDVFGVTNLKIPAGIVIAGLLLAAIGFEDF
jgi:hypothetical protein